MSSGEITFRDKRWFVFPSAEVGTEAWGRFVVSDPYYRKWLNNEQWALFARRYHGDTVPGFKAYFANLSGIASRFKERTEAAGWDI